MSKTAQTVDKLNKDIRRAYIAEWIIAIVGLTLIVASFGEPIGLKILIGIVLLIRGVALEFKRLILTRIRDELLNQL